MHPSDRPPGPKIAWIIFLALLMMAASPIFPYGRVGSEDYGAISPSSGSFAVQRVMGRDLAWAGDPPAIQPFGPRSQNRSDAIPGFIEMSDATIVLGRIYLTRGIRLKIYDASARRQREVPLEAVRKIECQVQREWMEKEWRFKENASDEKYYTGRTYPAREYVHTITLQDKREITGPISACVYAQEEASDQPGRFLLHKRHKGVLGSSLKSLVYVRRIELGYEAAEEGKRLIANQSKSSHQKFPSGTSP